MLSRSVRLAVQRCGDKTTFNRKMVKWWNHRMIVQKLAQVLHNQLIHFATSFFEVTRNICGMFREVKHANEIWKSEFNGEFGSSCKVGLNLCKAFYRWPPSLSLSSKPSHISYQPVHVSFHSQFTATKQHYIGNEPWKSHQNYSRKCSIAVSRAWPVICNVIQSACSARRLSFYIFFLHLFIFKKWFFCSLHFSSQISESDFYNILLQHVKKFFSFLPILRVCMFFCFSFFRDKKFVKENILIEIRTFNYSFI